ncbi:MAG: BrnA antitoxin family protein [Candidatus Korobacteraceae bacterium]|jgi:uncharacterized protein (DUF4415 family)
MKKRSKTNWDRVDALRDSQIDYSENPPLESDFFQKAIAWPGTKEQITLRLSPEVLGFFRRQGKGYQTAIGRVLEDFVEKQKNPPAEEELLLPFETRAFSSELQKYQRVKRNNFLATIRAFPHVWEACLRLDKIFLSEFADAENLRESRQVVPWLLLVQAHSQYRLAMELAFSAALSEAGSLLRQGIESAAFAHKLYREPKLVALWLSADESKAQKSAFNKAFVENRRANLFSGSKALEELHVHWCHFSEASTHASIWGMANRIDAEQVSTQGRWYFNYFELDKKVLAPELYRLLDVAHLIETAVFDVFHSRLQFDESLLKARALFARYKEQVRAELKSEIGSQAVPKHSVAVEHFETKSI